MHNNLFYCEINTFLKNKGHFIKRVGIFLSFVINSNVYMVNGEVDMGTPYYYYYYYYFLTIILCVCVSVLVEAEPDVLEEDVFQDEVVPSFLSPLQAESIDFPDTPVSFMYITNVLHHLAGSLQFLFFFLVKLIFQHCFIVVIPVPLEKLNDARLGGAHIQMILIL